MLILVLCHASRDNCDIYLTDAKEGSATHTNIRENAKEFESTTTAYEYLEKNGLSYSDYYATDKQTQDWLGELFRTFGIPFDDPEALGIAPHIQKVNDQARLVREALLAKNYKTGQQLAEDLKTEVSVLAAAFVTIFEQRIDQIASPKQ